ncbi:hypothetical protein BH23ACT9_BH23ACT9_33870 [soil metagenome]
MLWLVVVWVGTAITQAIRPPTCFGIGFGCEPDAATATLLVAALVGGPALVLGWLVTLIGWAVSARSTSPVARRWLVWGAPAVLATAAVVTAVGATVGELLA